MSNQDRLVERIEEQTMWEYMDTWEEIADYYQDNYPARQWIGELARDLTGAATGSKEYKNMRRNIERLASGTHKSPSHKLQDMLAELGRQLPGQRIPPKNVKVKVSGRVNPSPKRRSKGEAPRDRDFDADFSGLDALDFFEDPTLEAFFEEYGVDGEMFSDLLQEGADISVRMEY